MLCGVDVADVFTGARSARWVLGFVERCLVHPESETAARLRGGDEHWADWFAWSPSTTRIVQAANVAISAAGGKQHIELPPAAASPPTTGPVTREQQNAAHAQLMSML